ncbi:MAG: glutathione S-transferase [Phenylobacterium sp.]|nr:glutathione S-transferase [Phenylobacterium sp.]
MVNASAAHAAALWAGLCLILMLVLSIRVVRIRRRRQVGLGYGDQPELERAVRAFGNAAEYVPAALIALVLLAMLGAPAALVHAVGAALLAGRVLHAVGLSQSGGASWPRTLGMILTFLVYLMAGVFLIFYAVP